MSLDLNPKETAVVLIDLQKGIVERQLAPYSGTDVVSKSSRLAEAARNAGASVVYVHVLVNEVLRLQSDATTQQQSNNQQEQDDAPHLTEAEQNKKQSEASQLVEDAGRQDGDALVTKRQWDAFYATELDQILRRHNAKTIILGGIATNFGVESTARSAQARGYEVVFAHDAMTSMSEELHKFAVEKIFPLIGRVRSADEITAALGATKTTSRAAQARKSPDEGGQPSDQEAAKQQVARAPSKEESERKDDQKEPAPHVTKQEDPIAYN